MARRSKLADDVLSAAPPLPLSSNHWECVVAAIGLSPQQARVAELMLRDLTDKEIAAVLGISQSTLETHQERISLRTATRGRMQLAMRVLEESLRVNDQLSAG
jgi:DNA-binding NarL/FixJ family response regulator